MPLVFACIAPHGSIAIPEAKPKDRPTLANATTAGMQELGRRFVAAQPDFSIVLTPYNIHGESAMAVVHAAASRKRIALVASCDHGHGHDAKGPYGFTAKSKEFDEAVVGLIQGDGLLFSSLGSTFAREAKADSYWQMLMLEGALGEGNWDGELLSYEAPTYFGMLCAAYAPKQAS